jgi:hypothetical protein
MSDLTDATTALNNVVTNYSLTRDQIADLLGGTVDGGPNNNGLYPITAPDGTTRLVHSPAKYQAEQDRLVGTVTSGRVGAVSWTELAATTGVPVGTLGEVPASATGTHTDPVVGGTVSNAGVYRYAATGWKWLYASDGSAAVAAAARAEAAAAAVIPQAAATTTSNAAGGTTYSLVAGNVPFVDGVQYDFIVPALNSGGVTVKIGANSLILYDGNNNAIAPGALPSGSTVRIKLNLGGARFNLVNVIPNLDLVNSITADAMGAKKALQTTYGVPIGLALNGNPNTIGYNDFPAPANNAKFEVLITQANTGQSFVYANGPYLRIARGGNGADIAAGELVPGTILSLTRSDGGGNIAVIGSTRPISIPGAPNATDLASVVATASGTGTAFESLLGVPVALPAPDANNVKVAGGDPSDGQSFEAYIAANNTGAANLTRGGTTRRIVTNGGTGAGTVAGDLKAGTIRQFTYSAGGAAYMLGGARTPTFNATPPAPNPVGAQDSDLAYKPWGNITNTGSGSTVAAITKNIVVIGSSNAASSYVADGSRPDQFITTAINDLYVGTGINFVADLQAVQGAPWSSASGQLQASSAFNAGTAKWVFPFFWMNDCRSIFYHDNGGVQAQFNALVGIIDYIRSKGGEPVLSTGFHPDPRANPSASGIKALDPLYFSDTAAYPTGGTTRSMVYPVNKAAPVSPTADMVPAATLADFMVARDWSGNGIVRTGYKRVWHFNRTVREIAAAKGCMLLDLEVATYRYCLETVPDLASGLDTYYDITNPLHPKAGLYQAGVKPVINQWARAMAEGRDDIRVFKGF